MKKSGRGRKKRQEKRILRESKKSRKDTLWVLGCLMVFLLIGFWVISYLPIPLTHFIDNQTESEGQKLLKDLHAEAHYTLAKIEDDGTETPIPIHYVPSGTYIHLSLTIFSYFVFVLILIIGSIFAFRYLVNKGKRHANTKVIFLCIAFITSFLTIFTFLYEIEIDKVNINYNTPYYVDIENFTQKQEYLQQNKTSGENNFYYINKTSKEVIGHGTMSDGEKQNPFLYCLLTIIDFLRNLAPLSIVVIGSLLLPLKYYDYLVYKKIKEQSQNPTS